MKSSQLSHDILNIIERLRIMHDLIKNENYETIPKSEIKEDLKESLSQLENKFEEFLQ